DLNPSGPQNVEQATAALVGRSLDVVATIPWTVRVVREDGVALAATADFQPQRVNVVVENGTITEVLGLG
ncbi:MAG: Peptidase inhibitor family, partial [Actinomycetota bacterium]